MNGLAAPPPRVGAMSRGGLFLTPGGGGGGKYHSTPPREFGNAESGHFYPRTGGLGLNVDAAFAILGPPPLSLSQVRPPFFYRHVVKVFFKNFSGFFEGFKTLQPLLSREFFSLFFFLLQMLSPDCQNACQARTNVQLQLQCRRQLNVSFLFCRCWDSLSFHHSGRRSISQCCSRPQPPFMEMQRPQKSLCSF